MTLTFTEVVWAILHGHNKLRHWLARGAELGGNEGVAIKEAACHGHRIGVDHQVSPVRDIPKLA